jgi:hypothetical protein
VVSKTTQATTSAPLLLCNILSTPFFLSQAIEDLLLGLGQDHPEQLSSGKSQRRVDKSPSALSIPSIYPTLLPLPRFKPRERMGRHKGLLSSLFSQTQVSEAGKAEYFFPNLSYRRSGQ